MAGTVVVVSDLGIPDGVRDIVENLPQPKSVVPGTEVTLKFADNTFVYSTGLALLSTWRAALADGVNVRVDDSGCQAPAQRLLQNNGFIDLMERGPTAAPVQQAPGYRVPIQPIVQGTNAQTTIQAICGVLATFAGQFNSEKAFTQLLSELCENTYAHADFQTTGYICSNIHQRWLEIAVADSGIGIHESYIGGTNVEARKRIEAGYSAIDLAIDGLFSSKRDAPPGRYESHFGYGLFIVRRLIEENWGRLTVISGKEGLNIERHRRDQVHLTNAWGGTFVGLLIDVTRPLPLEAVYEQAIEETIGTRPAPGAVIQERTNTVDSTPSDPDEGESSTIEVLQHYGSQLLTRETGIALRADIATALAGGGIVAVQLQGVEDVTPSVADECFGKLAASLGRDEFDRRVRLTGASALMLRLIQLVVVNRVHR